MPYSKKVPTHRHEKQQIIHILRALQEVYSSSEEYCYCFINAEWENNDIRRQYDLLIFEKHCISIIELKSWKGALSLHVEDNKKEASIYKIIDGERSEKLKWNQIYHEQSYLKQYLSFHFRKIRNLDNKMKFRIDQYLVFNSPLNKKDVILNDIVKKWLAITTVDDFKIVFTAANKNQPFSLSEEDIQYIAHNKFGLRKIDIENVFVKNIEAMQILINDLNTLNQFDYDDEYINIVNNLLHTNRQIDLKSLVNKMNNINEILYNAENLKELRDELDDIHYYYDDKTRKKLIDDRFVSAVLNILNILLESYKNTSYDVDYRETINSFLDKIESLKYLKIFEEDGMKIENKNEKYRRRKDVLKTLDVILKIKKDLI